MEEAAVDGGGKGLVERGTPVLHPRPPLDIANASDRFVKLGKERVVKRHWQTLKLERVPCGVPCSCMRISLTVHPGTEAQEDAQPHECLG